MTYSAAAFESAPKAAPATQADRRALIGTQAEKLWALQHDNGHLVFEVEADCTIPA